MDRKTDRLVEYVVRTRNIFELAAHGSAQLLLGVGEKLNRFGKGIQDEGVPFMKQRFIPELLLRAPKVDRPNCKFPFSLEYFVFPNGFTLQTEQPKCSSTCFVLTELDGLRLYGFAYTRYEKLARHKVEQIREMARASDPSDGEIPDILWTPKSLVLLSYYPFYYSFLRLLNGFAETLPENVRLGAKAVAGLRKLVNVRPPKPSGTSRVTLPGTMTSIAFTLPAKTAFPLVDLDYGLLLANLSVDNIITVVTAMVNEVSLLFVSRSPKKLTLCIEALVSLLYPFEWQHVYIPLLPLTLLDFFHAPMPFIVGVHADFQRYADVPSHAFVVHLDDGVVAMPTDPAAVEGIARLPDEQLAKLTRLLHKLSGQFGRSYRPQLNGGEKRPSSSPIDIPGADCGAAAESSGTQNEKLLLATSFSSSDEDDENDEEEEDDEVHLRYLQRAAMARKPQDSLKISDLAASTRSTLAAGNAATESAMTTTTTTTSTTTTTTATSTADIASASDMNTTTTMTESTTTTTTTTPTASTPPATPLSASTFDGTAVASATVCGSADESPAADLTSRSAATAAAVDAVAMDTPGVQPEAGGAAPSQFPVGSEPPQATATGSDTHETFTNSPAHSTPHLWRGIRVSRNTVIRRELLGRRGIVKSEPISPTLLHGGSMLSVCSPALLGESTATSSADTDPAPSTPGSDPPRRTQTEQLRKIGRSKSSLSSLIDSGQMQLLRTSSMVKEKPRTLASAKFNNTSSQTQKMAAKLRHAFFRLFMSLFVKYRQFLIFPTDEVPEPDSYFDTEKFISAAASSIGTRCQKFLRRFMATQMFISFVQDRITRTEDDLFEKSSREKMQRKVLQLRVLTTASKSGWLHVCGALHKWKRRWFLLDGDMLRCYSSKTQPTIKGSFQIFPGRTVVCIPMMIKNAPTRFSFLLVNSPKAKLKLAADTEAERREWVSVLKAKAMSEAQRDALISNPLLQATTVMTKCSMIFKVRKAARDKVTNFSNEVKDMFARNLSASRLVAPAAGPSTPGSPGVPRAEEGDADEATQWEALTEEERKLLEDA